MKILPKHLLVILFFLMLSFVSFADAPPDPGGGPGGGDPPVGGGSPINGGTVFMLVLSLVYGIKRLYDSRNKLLD